MQDIMPHVDGAEGFDYLQIRFVSFKKAYLDAGYRPHVGGAKGFANFRFGKAPQS
jgi:hypothetical protein